MFEISGIRIPNIRADTTSMTSYKVKGFFSLSMNVKRKLSAESLLPRCLLNSFLDASITECVTTLIQSINQTMKLIQIERVFYLWHSLLNTRRLLHPSSSNTINNQLKMSEIKDAPNVNSFKYKLKRYMTQLHSGQNWGCTVLETGCSWRPNQGCSGRSQWSPEELLPKYNPSK